VKTAEAHSPPNRRSPKLKELRALSIRQPWAWLVVNGYKDIENRSWRTNHRGLLLIHASNNRTLTTPENLAAIKKKYRVRLPNDFDFGGIVGMVDVVDCVNTHPSKWKERGTWGWVLKNPRRLPFRECKGFVGFFRLSGRRSS
jgi:hypothetical protein